MFKIGDEVEFTRTDKVLWVGYWDTTCHSVGHKVIVEEITTDGKIKAQSCIYNPDGLRLVRQSIKKGGVMKNIISDVYEKTQDALLVEKWLGCEITDNFMGDLIVKSHKETILKEAKRKEAEEKKRLEK